MMPTIIVNSQEPVDMVGFANCSCSRVQFKKVQFIHLQFYRDRVVLSVYVYISVKMIHFR